MRQHKKPRTESSLSPEDKTLLEETLRKLDPAKRVDKHDEESCNITFCALTIDEKKELKTILRAVAKEKDTTYARLFCALLFHIAKERGLTMGYLIFSVQKSQSIFPLLRSISE